MFASHGLTTSRVTFLCALLLAACTPSSAGPQQVNEPVLDSGLDYFPTEQWRTAPPSALRMDTARIAQLKRDAASGRYGALHGLIIIRNGYVAVEEYYGWNRATPHTMQSITKSITSLLYGIAAGANPDALRLDRTALEMLPQYNGTVANVDDRKRALTLRNLLTMRTGMDFHENPYAGSPLEQLNNSRDDWVKLVLDARMRSQPGSDWAYNSGSPILMCGILREVTGEAVDAYARRVLFEPIGATGEWWYRSPFDALPHCGGGIHLRAMDLARVGYLVLREGRWGTRQIVSRAWIAESTSPHSSSPGLIFDFFNSSYGYYWWGFPTIRGGSERDIIAASGSGGQWLFVVPALDLVVAVVAENGAGLDLLYAGVLPSVL